MPESCSFWLDPTPQLLRIDPQQSGSVCNRHRLAQLQGENFGVKPLPGRAHGATTAVVLPQALQSTSGTSARSNAPMLEEIEMAPVAPDAAMNASSHRRTEQCKVTIN